MVFENEFISRQQKAAGTRRRIGDALAGGRLHDLDNGLDQRAGGKILARARPGILGLLLQQPFVNCRALGP